MQFDNCTVTDDSTNNKTIVKPDAPLILEMTYAEYLANKTALDASGNMIKITDQGIVNSASGVSYDNTGSGITAGNVQGAIDEIDADLTTQLGNNRVETNLDYETITGDLNTATYPDGVGVYLVSENVTHAATGSSHLLLNVQHTTFTAQFAFLSTSYNEVYARVRTGTTWGTWHQL